MLNIVVQTAAVTVQVGLSGFHEVFTASRIKLLDKNTNIFSHLTTLLVSALHIKCNKHSNLLDACLT